MAITNSTQICKNSFWADICFRSESVATVNEPSKNQSKYTWTVFIFSAKICWINCSDMAIQMIQIMLIIPAPFVKHQLYYLGTDKINDYDR